MSKKEKDTSGHYVNNKEFFLAMKEWKVVVNEALDSGDPKPPVTDYIGECFLKIAEHLSYRISIQKNLPIRFHILLK